MAKLLSQPVTETDMSKYLESSDFQLELDVFKSVTSRGIQSSHAGTYTDPVTKKDRQFDIRAEINNGPYSIRLAIECKNLKENYPLLVSRVPRIPSESFHEVILGRANSFPVESGDIYRMRNSTFRSSEPVGKSAAQVGKIAPEVRNGEPQIVSSDSETYEKWSQAIASAYDLVARSGHSSIVQEAPNAKVITPLLVVPDQMLWAVDYSAEGIVTVEPRKVEQCSLFLGKTIEVGCIRYTATHLMIYTKSAFDRHLDNLCDRHSDDWDNLFPDNTLFAKYGREGTTPM